MMPYRKDCEDCANVLNKLKKLEAKRDRLGRTDPERALRSRKYVYGGSTCAI
jgi:hypothetical protein